MASIQLIYANQTVVNDTLPDIDAKALSEALTKTTFKTTRHEFSPHQPESITGTAHHEHVAIPLSDGGVYWLNLIDLQRIQITPEQVDDDYLGLKALGRALSKLQAITNPDELIQATQEYIQSSNTAQKLIQEAQHE